MERSVRSGLYENYACGEYIPLVKAVERIRAQIIVSFFRLG